MVRYLFLVLLIATHTHFNVALPSYSVKGRMWWAAVEAGRAEKRSGAQIQLNFCGDTDGSQSSFFHRRMFTTLCNPE